MAYKQIKELSDSVKTYFERLNELDFLAVRISSISMVDPGEWGEVTREIRDLAIHLSNINSVLAMALDTSDFIQALSSRKNLVRSMTDVISKIKVEQPDSELIPEYEKVLKDHRKTLLLLEETAKFRNQPKSKKKYSRWLSRGWIDNKFEPFTDVELTLSNISNFLEDCQ